jgi:hypothetical protein
MACPTGGLVNLVPGNICTLSDVAALILSLVTQIGSILLVIALVYTGFLFIQAQGNSEQISKARGALLWVVLGGLLLLGAGALSQVIKSTVESL